VGLADKAAPKKPAKKRRRRKPRRLQRPQRLVRTVVATTAENEAFGWQVAAEVHRRGLDQAKRKCCLGDGSLAIWALFEFHLLAAGFIGILDFLHLLAHLYAGACAAEGKGTEAAWALYTRWLCWAWSGKVVLLLGGLRAVCQRLGEAPAEAGEDDPRCVAAETLTYVENNRGRMNYPEYRRLGLPISSAPVESVIKQLNRRVKGSEKFWLEQGAEAILQVRAAYLSEDGRAESYWKRPRPHRRAVGEWSVAPAGSGHRNNGNRPTSCACVQGGFRLSSTPAPSRCCTDAGHAPPHRTRAGREGHPARGRDSARRTASRCADRGRCVGRERGADVSRSGRTLGRTPHRGSCHASGLRGRPGSRLALLQYAPQ